MSKLIHKAVTKSRAKGETSIPVETETQAKKRKPQPRRRAGNGMTTASTILGDRLGGD